MGIIRFLLAITVVIAHSNSLFGFNFVGSEPAVKSFFIISGFYMSLVLNEKYVSNNASYLLFIKNRFLRLYPIYWVVLSLTLAASIFYYFKTNGENFGRLEPLINNFKLLRLDTLFLIIFSNIFIFFQDLMMFLGINHSNGSLEFVKNYNESNPPLHFFLLVPQAWSVGLELMFYLIAPFLLKSKKKVFFALSCSILLKFILIKFNLFQDPWSYRFFPTELAFFMFGFISYNIYKEIIKYNFKILEYILYILTILFTLFFDKYEMEYKIYFYYLIFTISIPFIFKLTKNWKWDSIVGDLSYPIYISHIFIYFVLKATHKFDNEYLSLFLIIFTSIFSYVLNITISAKIEKIRQKRFVK